MSLKRRIERLENQLKIEEPGVVFYDLVVTGVKGEKPIYHYEKLTRTGTIKLTEEEYQKDTEQELEKGNIVILDDIIKGLDDLSVEELKILALR